MVRRQGTSKTVSELEDICSALKTLSETDSMPMFFGTSEMIMHTPVYNIETGTCNNEMISSRLRVLEESVNSLITLAKINANKPPSNTTETNKASNIPETDRPVSEISDRSNETNHAIDFHLQGQEVQLTERSNTLTFAENVTRTRNLPPIQGNQVISETSELTKDTSRTNGESATTALEDVRVCNETDIPWTDVVRRNRNEPPKAVEPHTPQSTNKRNWRSNLQILHGTARDEFSGGRSYSADVELVAYGLNKNVNALQLSKFLQGKGLAVKDCRLLTKSEEARSLSFVITIKATDLELAKKTRFMAIQGRSSAIQTL